MNLEEARAKLKELIDAARYEFGIGSEDQRNAFIKARFQQGKQQEGPRMTAMAGSYRTPQVIKEVMGIADKNYIKARKAAEVPVRTGSAAQKAGSVLGAIGADLTQDHGRRFWWLLNAPQAVGEIVSETLVARNNPDLYSVLEDRRSDIDPNTLKNIKEVGRSSLDPLTGRRRTRLINPGNVQALSILPGVAINQALGLLTPYGS